MIKTAPMAVNHSKYECQEEKRPTLLVCVFVLVLFWFCHGFGVALICFGWEEITLETY